MSEQPTNTIDHPEDTRSERATELRGRLHAKLAERRALRRPVDVTCSLEKHFSVKIPRIIVQAFYDGTDTSETRALVEQEVRIFLPEATIENLEINIDKDAEEGTYTLTYSDDRYDEPITIGGEL